MAITFHPNGKIDGLNNSNFRESMPSGSVLQVKTDTLDRDYLDLSTTVGEQLGSDLEVSITFSSTSNLYVVSCFIPDIWAFSTTGRALHGGFSYSTDNFGSSTILNVHPISDHIGYAGGNDADLDEANWSTSGNCPTTSPIKIRPRLECISGPVRIFANNMGVALLTVMEIKA
tara:strand:- start:24 stop:542 length:519 start_codon:yes stop_codon:yes gene_type:complete